MHSSSPQWTRLNPSEQVPMGSDTAEEMPEAEEIEKYLNTPPDGCAIQQYLRLGPPRNLALLAAQMAPNRSRFNAEELVARAAQLQERAEQHLWLERTMLASSMNHATLLELAERLGSKGRDFPGSSLDETNWHDPLAGPLVRRLAWWEHWIGRHKENQKFLESFDHLEDLERFFRVENASEALAIADKQNHPKRPGENCSLIDALRWATNEPEARAEHLEDAFRDKIRISPWEPLHLKGDAAIHAAHKRVPERTTDRDKDYAELQKFRKNFHPRMKAPSLADYFAFYALRYWKGPICNQKLAWLYTEFRQFWIKHRENYINAESRALATSEKRRQAAMTKHAKDQKGRFMDYLGRFFDYIGEIPISSDRIKRQKVFVTFADDILKLPQHERQEEVVDFLEILHSHSDESPEIILTKLRRSKLERFNALPESEREKRLGGMKPIHRANIGEGKVPNNLKAFAHLEEAAVAECLELWHRKTSRTGTAVRKKKVQKNS